MKHKLMIIRNAVLTMFVVVSIALWAPRGCIAINEKKFELAIPPPSVQTFDDFLQWQTQIDHCWEVEVRGVTYFHVIGPRARTLYSGGALYVFDAKGNFVGWSKDVDDVMRNEAIFYPNWWLPEASSMKAISLDELKVRIQGET